MPAELAQLWDRAAADPVLLYSAAAALLLAVVSLSSGVIRRDFLALGRPRILLRVLGAVAAACVLKVLEVYLGPSLPEQVASVASGLHRLPLYLVALAYGPVTGAAVGSLFAGFAASAALPGWPEVVLALELAVLGWLAIYPSPRDTRLAGPFNAALAYVLAWGTAGLALAADANETVTASLLYAEHAEIVPGLLACVLLLALFGPAVFRKAFPGSRIYPPALRPSRSRAAAAPAIAGADNDVDWPPARDARRELTLSTLALEPNDLPDPDLAGRRQPRRRRLEPRRLPEEFSR